MEVCVDCLNVAATDDDGRCSLCAFAADEDALECEDSDLLPDWAPLQISATQD